MSSPAFVSCIWADVWADAVESVTLKDAADKHRPMMMETYGWLLYEDSEGISIAAERCLDKGDESYRGRSFILKVLIKTITPVQLTKPRQRRAKKTPVNPPSDRADAVALGSTP